MAINMAEASAEEVDGTRVVQDGQQEISNSKGEPSAVAVERTHAIGEADVVPTSDVDDDLMTTEPARRGRGGEARGRGRGKQLASGLGVEPTSQSRSSRSKTRIVKRKTRKGISANFGGRSAQRCCCGC